MIGSGRGPGGSLPPEFLLPFWSARGKIVDHRSVRMSRRMARNIIGDIVSETNWCGSFQPKIYIPV